MSGDMIRYNPAQIHDALGGMEVNRKAFQEGAERIQAAYLRLEGNSRGTSITAAGDAQRLASGLRDETNANTERVKVECLRSLEDVQRDDLRFANILGG